MRSPAPLLAGLFPEGVATAEAAPSAAHEAQLLDEERDAVARSVPRRRREYAAGRCCARALMSSLGVDPAPLLNDGDRAPIWPEALVGSISHTRGRCAVACARRGAFRALGLDVERDEPVRSALWGRICTSAERADVEARPPRARGRVVRLLFSAKEAFYKCQYTLTRQFLGFHAVRVELFEQESRFEVLLLRPSGPIEAGGRFAGRFHREDGYVVTAMAWRA